MNSSDSGLPLFDRLLAGEEAACTEVFRAYNCRLIGLMIAKQNEDDSLRSKFDPEDVVQSAFKTFFRRARAGEFSDKEGGDFQLWNLLAVICKNKLNDRRKWFHAQKRDANSEMALIDELQMALSKEPTPDDVGSFEEMVRLVMDQLDDRGRLVFELWLARFSVAETALKIGNITNDMVKAARRKIREIALAVAERQKD